MFFCRYFGGVASFFLALCFFVPQISHAFEIFPPVADVSFADGTQVIEQIFSVTHNESQPKTYEASVHVVTFFEDGSIDDLEEAPSSLSLDVSPASAVVLPGAEQMFTVTFGNSSLVTSEQVFALVLEERGNDDDRVSAGFIALLFPEDVQNTGNALFRIDAFSAVFADDGLRAVAQFTNTGTALVKPRSLIVVHDVFGRELFRGVFAEHEGRLPVGTTRIVSDTLSFVDFGVWHVGGFVDVSLFSLASVDGEMQYASIKRFTFPGVGILGSALFVFLLCVGAAVFLWKKRGILRA